MYWKSASKYSIQAVTISMYMLINFSKTHKIIKDQNTVLCFHTLYSEKPADNYNVIKFQFHNTKRIRWIGYHFVAMYGTLSGSIKNPPPMWNYFYWESDS